MEAQYEQKFNSNGTIINYKPSKRVNKEEFLEAFLLTFKYRNPAEILTNNRQIFYLCPNKLFNKFKKNYIVDKKNFDYSFIKFPHCYFEILLKGISLKNNTKIGELKILIFFFFMTSVMRILNFIQV